MPSKYFLENSILEDMQLLKNSIDNRKYWVSFNYDYTFDKIEGIVEQINNKYLKKTGSTLKEASRRIHENIFVGDVDLYITYIKPLLYLTKLKLKVEHHRKYGVFPTE